jgi:hypothetical protein
MEHPCIEIAKHHDKKRKRNVRRRLQFIILPPFYKTTTRPALLSMGFGRYMKLAGSFYLIHLLLINRSHFKTTISKSEYVL